VTVVICSRDRPALLLDTVRSVLAGRTLPAELVVVDQSDVPNSDLSEMGAPRGCRVRYLHTATAGLSAARNIGLRAATGEVAVMVDDDMLVEPDWLESLVAGLPPGRLGVATGRVLPAPDEGTGGTIPPAALVTREAPEVFRGPQATDVVPGANVAFRREPLLHLGGYDERLGAGTRAGSADDNDIGHRLLVAGAEVRHVPEAVVYHRAWRPRSELLRLRWRYGRGKGAFYAKHVLAGDVHVRGRLAADVGARLRRAATSLMRSPRRTAAELVAVAGIASGALEWLVREGRRPNGGASRSRRGRAAP
jgi:glycosyltransferase involved in cell wall biosynthesis